VGEEGQREKENHKQAPRPGWSPTWGFINDPEIMTWVETKNCMLNWATLEPLKCDCRKATSMWQTACMAYVRVFSFRYALVGSLRSTMLVRSKAKFSSTIMRVSWLSVQRAENEVSAEPTDPSLRPRFSNARTRKVRQLANVNSLEKLAFAWYCTVYRAVFKRWQSNRLYNSFAI